MTRRDFPYHPPMTTPTVVHVTHEACEKMGGIGAVLEGILTSPAYQRHVKRSILVGPAFNHLEAAPHKRLGPEGKVLYSTVDGIDETGLGGRLRPIEWAFNVAFVYGKRTLSVPGDARTAEAEVLLVDVFNVSQARLDQFKLRLWQVFGIDSTRYEKDWSYEEYVRLAEPAFYALLALQRPEELPCLLVSHEFMGLPAAFKAVLDGGRQFRSIFYAHECSTARQIVENHPGHDTSFYNILREAQKRRLYVGDVFGDRSASPRHALICRSHLCDAIVAVGDYTAQEMHFLDPHFDHHRIDLVHNGIPAMKVTWDQRRRSRAMLAEYAQRLTGGKPDVLMTHVTRPVISKGIWRDLRVCHELDSRLAARGQTAVLFIVTTAGGTRRPQDVRQMEEEYGWPRRHRAGFPDLVGPELDISRDIDAFNARHANIQAILVNQFGWSHELVGNRVPPELDFAAFRWATDVEFGMATYEPFGISPLEPLGAGAICVISNVCGCKGFVEEAASGKPIDNVLVADFTRLDWEKSIEELLGMTQEFRDEIEKRVAAGVAYDLMRRLPATDAGRQALLESGQGLVQRLGWDHVLETRLIPMAERLLAT